MHKHPDADAFVLEHLRRPANATTRLAFADWLDETGTPSNAAWARYIRLRERGELTTSAGVRARLALAARVFARDPESVLQLIPAANVAVRLAGFDVPRAVLELVPESVARENLVLPLALDGRALYCAAADPVSYDTAEKLTFILNKDVVLVRAEIAEVQESIGRGYGESETESVTSVLIDYTYPPLLVSAAVPAAVDPVVRIVNTLLLDAVDRRVSGIRVEPDTDSMVVQYRVGDEPWPERDRAPLRLLRPLTARLALMADIPADLPFAPPLTAYPLTGTFDFSAPAARYHTSVVIHPSPDGPTTQIDLFEVPA